VRLIILAIASILLAAAPVSAQQRAKGDVQRGAYVARLAGCITCHSDPKKGDAGFLAGGAPIKTPFGTFHPPNVTPHPEDGIGGWTFENFRTALKKGEAPDGSHYYPVFPYDSYANMTERDIADLWAAWQTVPPVAGTASDHDIDFPYNVRVLMEPWKALFLDEGTDFTEAADNAVTRGAYIVNGPGHCAACHTPRNALGAPDRGDAYQGASLEPTGEKVPAITGTALKKRGWMPRSLAFGLRTGLTPNGDSLGGTMGEVVRHSTAWLTDSDRAAIAAYLFSLE
jgi:mono/diheme cytochrome c family protein